MFLDELLDLLQGAAGEPARIEHRVEIDLRERRLFLQPIQQLRARTRPVLGLRGHGMAVGADDLVKGAVVVAYPKARLKAVSIAFVGGIVRTALLIWAAFKPSLGNGCRAQARRA